MLYTAHKMAYSPEKQDTFAEFPGLQSSDERAAKLADMHKSSRLIALANKSRDLVEVPVTRDRLKVVGQTVIESLRIKGEDDQLSSFAP
jgi:hypothetical protein